MTRLLLASVKAVGLPRQRRNNLLIREIILAFLCFSAPGIFAQASFVDVTVSKGFLSFQSPGVYGSGAAAADFDKDGYVDLFVPTDEHFPNYLYRNLGNGEFEEVAAVSGIADKMRTRAAIWFDFNGDHLLDLFVAGDCRLTSGCPDSSVMKLYQQNSSSKFVDVTKSSGLLSGHEFTSSQMVGGLAAGDLNNDGFMDLMVTYWHGTVHLFINQRDGTFTDLGASKLTPLNQGYLQPLLYDFNKDGLTDIYLNVDGGANMFWLNNGNNSFSEMADKIQLNTSLNEMGTALGDYDNDGDMDIYLTNVTGNQTHNVLFRNDSRNNSLSFSEIAKDVGVHEGGWGWGTSFFDANNDGLLDLAETNGISVDWRMPLKFWLQDRKGNFVDFSAQAGFVHDLDGTTLIAFDFDRDGDLDLVETLKKRQGQNIDLRLLENQLDKEEKPGNYIVIKPRMTGKNHFAIGSTVTISVGNTQMSRPILAGNSFYGQEPAEAFFGLGHETKIDKISVEWPGGTISSMEGVVDVNQVLTITDEDILHTPNPLKIAAVDLSDLTIEWGHNSTSETGFLLQKSLTKSFATVVEFDLDEQVRSFNDKDLEVGIKYYYRLRAVNANSASQFSKIIEVTLQEEVVGPTELKAIRYDHQEASLQWKDNSKNEIAFVIHRSESDHFENATEMTVGEGVTNFTDTGLKPNTSYYYRVGAIGEKGVSPFGETIIVLTRDFIKNPDHLKGTFHAGEIELSWTDQSDNESGYLVERSISELFFYSSKFYLGRNANRFVDNEVVAESPFFYRVRAYNEKAFSEFSNILSIVATRENHETGREKFEIFPNPSKGLTNIEFMSDYIGLITVTVTSTTGQVISEKVYEKTNTSFRETVNIYAPPGIYIIIITTHSGFYQRKLILQK